MTFAARLTYCSFSLLFACTEPNPSSGGPCGPESCGDDTTAASNTSATNTAASRPDSSAGPTATTTAASSDPTTTADSTAGLDSASDSTTAGPPRCVETTGDDSPSFALERVADGFRIPVLALGHPTRPAQLFVVEQGGTVRILDPGQTRAPTDAFLQIPVACAAQPTNDCEMGLYGLAFHPEFPTDPRVYVSYAPAGMASPPTRVAEFSLAADDDRHVDPDSFRIVLDAAQPFGNHNGGMIAFGPDGYLYLGLGDGGGSSDTAGTGRDRGVILSKMLRIGVEPDGSPDRPMACAQGCARPGPFDYTIPPDNPFVDAPDFAPEIYAWGFRNPWRFSFDALTGDLWVGDVGQGAWEEIDLVVAGADYGWSAMEGNHCANDPGCDTSAAPNQPNGVGQVAPVLDYFHTGGACSVTGGSVYRSCEVPAWDGIYLYADLCTGDIHGLRWNGRSAEDLGAVISTGDLVTGSGWNAHGDVFFTTTSGVYGGPVGDGAVLRVVPAG